MNRETVEELCARVGKGADGRTLTAAYTQKIDYLMREIVRDVGLRSHAVILAIGGYGRGEMAPFSDIDIMFFAPDREHTHEAEQFLYKLWDTGLEISHCFRTAGECIEEAFRDIRTRTSLLEARYVAGDEDLYEMFRKKVYPVIAYTRQKEFIREKLRESERRHIRSGESLYLLEPHVKEGEGGLRDFHTAYWLAKVARKIGDFNEFLDLLKGNDRKRFAGAVDFLLKTRFILHLESGRKNDVLSFEYHNAVAHRLGFRDSRKFRASERMLRYYYLKSRVVRQVARDVMALCSKPFVRVHKDFSVRKLTDDFSVAGGRLIATRANLFALNPVKIIEAFSLYARTGRAFSDSMKEQVRSNLLRISTGTRRSPEAIGYFLEILRGSRVYATLREMHETGVLGRFIPEFDALKLLVVHEPYHMYTVDEHTLIAIRNLERLRTVQYGRHEDLHAIFQEVEHADTLYMAILFHDIGKAVGRHHEEEGYKRLKNIMERFNLDIGKRTRIEFLVRNHIDMAKTALKREASDIEVITRFADTVEDHENLKALYLITYADMSAVNPKFWTTWKAFLLRELYKTTSDYLAGFREDRREYVRALGGLRAGTDADHFRDFVLEMPERYILSTSRNRIVEDYRLVQDVKERGFSMRIDSDVAGLVEMSISAEDCPGLFSRIVGFLSSKGLNIVSGRIYTGRNGIVIDKIAVSNWKDIWWDGLAEDLDEGLKNIIVNDQPVAVIRRNRKPGSLFDIFIEVDNEASDDFTLVEVFSPDRMGLLYDISNVMFTLGIDIVSARITTESDLAQDIFSVRHKKQKLLYDKVQELLSEIWVVLQ